MTYTEENFEDHIEEQLLNSGFKSHSTNSYDKSLCLVPDEVLQFIQESQPKTYKKLENQYGSQTSEKLLKRLSSEIESRGVIEVLRNEIKERGCHFKLVYFEPKSGLNPKHQELYQKNCFSLIRQLKYSVNNENSVDMGIFINGIPISMIELKNSLTGQNHLDGEKQFKSRDHSEPLFLFKRCLVFFSVGNEKVSMTTRLSGTKTKFLPYNKGIENPINQTGHKTSYLWEEVLLPDSVLDLIENYVHIRKEVEKVYDPETKRIVEKKSEILVFPRYHQLNVIRELKDSVIKEDVGNNYLIEHTTGSGKSLSIGWLSHLLTSLHRNPSDTKRMFDSVIVLTDRKVLDKQIQNTIKQLEQTKGVVSPVDIDSQQLKDYLEKGKHIIITTVQKFPVISGSISELKSKTFGVIIDEVHSSQSGETSRHIRKSLSKSIKEDFKEGEGDEDLTEVDKLILNEISLRGKQSHISYFGFSGTPKNKTLEVFGRKDSQGEFRSFDRYSMKQSISEGFTHDVLQNYTTYKRYFKLNQEIKEDSEVPSSEVKKMLVRWVDLQSHTISEKTRIILEHFVNHTSSRIGGRSRGMVVTQSRLHTVKYKLEFDKQMKKMGLSYGCLVGFSGSVFDEETNKEYTESSMNSFSETKTQESFKDPKYRILIVTNKFQTGFDEPFLHTMYVDKVLRGLQCVQTLSRLNRTTSGKTNTFVLDFVNDTQDIQDSFQPYFEGTVLTEETDPSRLYSIEQEIKKFNVFQKEEVNEFVNIFYDERVPQEELQTILDSVVETWRDLEEKEQEEFRTQIYSFIRLYGYISQIISFKDIDLEKLYIFLRNLSKKLPKRPKEDISDITDSIDLEYFRIEKKKSSEIELEEREGELEPIGGTSGYTPITEQVELLSEIISILNESFGSDLTEDDKVNLERMKNRISENEELRKVVISDNTESNKRHVFDKIFNKVLLDLVSDNLGFYKKISEPKRNDFVKNMFYKQYSTEGIKDQITVVKH